MEKIKKESIKNRIVTAAWQLFYEKGYNGTTVDDIIELSGTSKGSFYYYFNTKDELLNTLSMILDDFYEELEVKMDANMNSFYKLLYINYEAHSMMKRRLALICWHLCIRHSLWLREKDICWIRTEVIINW